MANKCGQEPWRIFYTLFDDDQNDDGDGDGSGGDVGKSHPFMSHNTYYNIIIYI